MAYEDLRQAIRSRVLVTAPPATIIAADELSQAAWIFDFRALFLQSTWLKRYAEIFWEQYENAYPFQVCGMESAAISLVSAIVMEGAARGKPVNGLFIRKSRKRYGLMKQLEGTPTKEPVIIVDDLINSGRTLEKQVKVLEREGLTVSDFFVIIAFREHHEYEALLTQAHCSLRFLFYLKEFGITLEQPRSVPTPWKEMWHFTGKGAAFNHVVQKSAPALDKHRVYFGTDMGTLFSLEQKSGSIAWEFNTGAHPPGKGIFSSPAVHSGCVYFGAYDGNVYALDAANGTKRWSYEEADWVGSSPALAPDIGRLFIGLEFGLFRRRGGIVALDMASGKRMWEYRMPEYTHGSPLYIREHGMVVIGSNDDMLYGFRADTGTLLWRYRTAGSVKSSLAYDPAHQLILCGSLGGMFYMISPLGVPVCATELGAGVYSTPLVVGDSVYVASLDKHLYAFELATGKQRWRYATQGRIFASPAQIGTYIYIGSNDGCVHEVDTRSGTGGPIFQATERVINKVAYNAATGQLFVPTIANELYCIVRPS